ncbi:membrane lipoprotein [Halorhabdus tiamatea SARL4B]|uniref:Membrane lipoprotein n=1 Tax=Halorhabdus tiamatea SARL4B TaxID=1033806 RepID=U2FB56_9EURY|nr:hypothetical protein [Halorhabdus tiamatea]ERJ07255.1 membrane lipoprotein [Halorhabdus tiamatea SARL4B]
MRRRTLLAGLSTAAVAVTAGCASLSSCENETRIRLVRDPPPPTYRDAYEPIVYEELPADERAFLDESFVDGPLAENELHVVCTTDSAAARSFTDRVQENLREADHGGAPMGGAPHVYVSRNETWYDIFLFVNGTQISF